MVKLFFVVLIFPIAITLITKRIDSGRRKSLREQAGTFSVHGNAANSLRTEKMRISKNNRDKGVIGELGVAKDIEYLAQEYGLKVLHDLSMPGTKANIDHVIVSSKVVYVIDAKNYTGIVKVAPNKAGVKTLRVGGRDQSAIVGKLKTYADAIENYLNSEGIEMKVLPLLAFYRAKFHEESSVSINGVTVNVFGIENEILRYAKLKAEEQNSEFVASLILKKFPPKLV